MQDSKNLMSSLISEKLAEWQIYNVNPESENYMNSAAQREAMEYITKHIISEMTPVKQYQLSIAYNMDTQEDQIKSILNEAKLAVLNHAITQNSRSGEEAMQNFNLF